MAAFDLDKVIAEQPRPARKKPFEFTFDGTTYKMRTELDSIALRAANTGDMVTAFRRVLSAEDYAAITASSTLLEYETLVKLMTAYYDHLGGKAGESSASSRSSKSTARPSKRTSKGSTRRAT